jgi:hypothetical protein
VQAGAGLTGGRAQQARAEQAGPAGGRLAGWRGCKCSAGSALQQVQCMHWGSGGRYVRSGSNLPALEQSSPEQGRGWSSLHCPQQARLEQGRAAALRARAEQHSGQQSRPAAAGPEAGQRHSRAGGSRGPEAGQPGAAPAGRYLEDRGRAGAGQQKAEQIIVDSRADSKYICLCPH